jgi:hypothetical protein
VEDFLNNQIDRGSGQQDKLLLIRINEKLPPYRFQLIPDLKSDFRRERRHHIGRIKISKSSSNSILQIIEVQSYADASWLSNSFKAEDINFDGYLDLAVLDDHGAKWGSYNYWLFDKRTGHFMTNVLTAELRELRCNEIRLDPKGKLIHTSNLIAGCADSESDYRIVRGHLILLRAEDREAKEGHCIVTRRERINGRMKVIRIKEEPRRDN